MSDTPAPTTEIATIPASGDLQLTATQPAEMAQCQISLIEWTKAKILEMQAEEREMSEAYEQAVKSKWKSEPLKRFWAKAVKRVEFYKKMLSALEHGFVIIPNFPVTVFAIRTNRENPLSMMTYQWQGSHEQKPEGLPEGTGVYKNPFPLVFERETSAPTPENKDRTVKHFSAESWKELEFPVTMAKANIIEVTSRAMALKLFDDFGIMPERKKEDPIIVGRLKDPRSTKYQPRYVTFMVAWYLNTKVL